MFESPAAEVSEPELSLDSAVRLREPSVYLMEAGTNALAPYGIFKGDTLVVDRSKKVFPGSIVVAVLADGFCMRVWQIRPSPALVSPLKEFPDIPIGEEGIEVWGVVTHSLRRHRCAGDSNG